MLILMKRSDIREIKTITLPDEESPFEIPEGWEVIKEPTKITENGVDMFKVVIAKAAKEEKES